MKSWARYGYVIFAWLLVLGVLLQTLLAGLATFGARTYWSIHASLGLVVGPLFGLILIVLAFASRLPRRTHRLSVILGFLAILQAALIYPGKSIGLAVTALHPVNALVLFWLGLHIATEAMSFVPPPSGGEGA